MTDPIIGLQTAVNRAQEARTILESALYVESFAALEAQLIAAWIASDPRDMEGRERCFAQVHANRKQKDFFASILSGGSIAEAEIKQLRETSEHKKRFGIS